MTKISLEKGYRFNGVAYGPGKDIEVPDEAAKKIRAFQKDYEGGDTGRKQAKNVEAQA